MTRVTSVMWRVQRPYALPVGRHSLCNVWRCGLLIVFRRKSSYNTNLTDLSILTWHPRHILTYQVNDENQNIVLKLRLFLLNSSYPFNDPLFAFPSADSQQTDDPVDPNNYFVMWPFTMGWWFPNWNCNVNISHFISNLKLQLLQHYIWPRFMIIKWCNFP